MVHEQCCHSQLEELYCTTGINLASEQESCAAPREDSAGLEAMFVKVRTRVLSHPHGGCPTPHAGQQQPRALCS